MLPIANQPILLYGLKHLAAAGIRDVGVVLGPIHEGIQETIGDGSGLGLRVTYIHQGDPKGLAHAVLISKEFLAEDPFVMYLGDNLLQEGVREFVKAYDRYHPDAVVGASPVAQPEHYGVIELDGDRIVSIQEKPAHPKSNLALIGVYLFGPAIHSIVAKLQPSRRGELEITDAIWQLVETGHTVIARRVAGWWKDTGRPEDLLDANELVLRTTPPQEFHRMGAIARGAIVEGPVGVGAGSVVEAGAEIVGPAILGAGVHIKSGGKVGPYTALGDGVTLADASIRRSIVLEGSEIDGPIRIADSLIGRNVLLRASRTDDREVNLTLGDAARLLL
jgi:glucose-1-phosphate thymidylyltransferase